MSTRILQTTVLFLVSGLVGVNAALAADSPRQCQPLRLAQEGDSVPGQAIVGLDLRVFWHCLQFERTEYPCRAFARVFSEILPQDPSKIPNPWDPRDDNVGLAEETAEFLKLAERFWARLVSGSGDQGGLREIFQPITRPERGQSETSTSLLVAGDVVEAETKLNNFFRALDPSFIATSVGGTNPYAPLIEVAPNFQIATQMGFQRHVAAIPGVQPVVNDPLLAAQWHLSTAEVSPAWENGIIGQYSTRIAILDSGFDPLQKDLPLPFMATWFCQNDQGLSCDSSESDDPSGHGTAVAGIIGSKTNNLYRVAGVNWFFSPLNLKVLGRVDRGVAKGNVYDAVKALDAASSYEAVVASLAWGGRSAPPELWNAILRARAADMLVVAAAGNQQIDLDRNKSFFPAAFRHPTECQQGCQCLDNLLVVGATTLKHEGRREKKASDSNYGPQVVSLGAPGVGLTTTGLESNSGVADASGTSAATALVVGAAGLVADAIRGTHAGRDRFVVIRDRLLDGADQFCLLRRRFGEGRRLNVYNAVEGNNGKRPTCP